MELAKKKKKAKGKQTNKNFKELSVNYFPF